MTKKYIRNAKIWTADDNRPWAEAVLIEDKKILAVGEAAELDALALDAEVIDAEGRMLTPAFIDSHTHVISIAKTMWYLLLDATECEKKEDFFQMVKDYCDEHTPEEKPYIYAYSCPTDFLDEEGVDKHYLDSFVSDRPVLVCDLNFHRCLLNSKMLELMEIDENTPYDETTSCNYLRYEGTNEPTGMAEERPFEFHHDIDKMFKKLNWYPPTEDDPDVIGAVMDVMAGFGITCVHDGFNDNEKGLIGMKALEEQGRLHCYYKYQPLVNTMDGLETAISQAHEWQEKYGDDYLYVDCIKVLLDGTNELGTGAYLDPVIGEPDNYGTMNYSEDELVHIFSRANQEGLAVQVHLVGDRAFRTSLNAVERAQADEKAAGRDFTSRINLLHCEITHPDDRKRPAQLGVHINFTPIWAGGAFGDASMKYIGEEKFNDMYAFNEMIESGAIVNFSSDMVDEEGLYMQDPMLGIEVGHTRVIEALGTPMREPAREKLSLQDLLIGFTKNNAIAVGLEDKIGSIEPGKMANICFLSNNIFEIPANKIKETKIEKYMFEGEFVQLETE